MKIDRDTWNDLDGVIERVDRLQRAVGPLKGMISHETVRKHVPRKAFLAALAVIDRQLQDAQEWAASLRKQLE